MHTILKTSYEVIYYTESGRQIYYPASNDSVALAEKLREANARGLNARLSEQWPMERQPGPSPLLVPKISLRDVRAVSMRMNTIVIPT
jgi:hypothetical protein